MIGGEFDKPIGLEQATEVTGCVEGRGLSGEAAFGGRVDLHG